MMRPNFAAVRPFFFLFMYETESRHMMRPNFFRPFFRLYKSYETELRQISRASSCAPMYNSYDIRFSFISSICFASHSPLFCNSRHDGAIQEATLQRSTHPPPCSFCCTKKEQEFFDLPPATHSFFRTTLCRHGQYQRYPFVAFLERL
jgi:hypothetical protein